MIDLKDLCISTLNLVCNSCFILNENSQSPDIYWKGLNNPVTKVDLLIHYFLINNIKKNQGSDLFNIIGEEDHTKKQDCPDLNTVQEKAKSIEAISYITELPNLVIFSQKYEAKHICLWIDPLDCTQGLISNRKHQTTILIGISYKGKPICGIIGQPYVKEEATNFEPSVYFGSTEQSQKFAFQFKIKDKMWEIIHQENNDSKYLQKTAFGYRIMGNRQQNLVKKMHFEVVIAGGAGYKCLKVIKKEVGSLIFIDAKTSKWDTCAGEAIIRSMGGFSINPNLQQISYSSNDSVKNDSGFIFTLSQQIFEGLTNELKSN